MTQNGGEPLKGKGRYDAKTAASHSKAKGTKAQNGGEPSQGKGRYDARTAASHSKAKGAKAQNGGEPFKCKGRYCARRRQAIQWQRIYIAMNTSSAHEHQYKFK